MPECQVCGGDPGREGSLLCGHSFCPDCFNKYVTGSLDELRGQLRCSICGCTTSLISDSHCETSLTLCGRQSDPQLVCPMGIAVDNQGGFVITDSAKYRIHLFDEAGRPGLDFAHIHGHRLQSGVVKTEAMIVAPFHTGSQVCLAYYTHQGQFRGNAYLGPDVKVGGIVIKSDNELLVTDINNHCIYLVNNDRKVITKTFNLDRLNSEVHTPRPCGIALNDEDQMVVTDVANHCVRVYYPNGQLAFVFGREGSRASEFQEPVDIAIAAQGHLVVVDKGNQRVQVFTRHGHFLSFCIRFRLGPEVFLSPIGVAITRDNMAAVLLSGAGGASAGEVRVCPIREHMQKPRKITQEYAVSPS